jgi:hypothetical protein
MAGEVNMRTVFFVCILLASAVTSYGQTSSPVNKPLAEINYRPVGKLIYVPVQVNGSSPLWFCFDTGAPNSLIDEAAAQKLKVRAVSSGVIHGTGKGKVSASDAGEVQFTVGGLTTRVPHAKIVDLSKVPLPAKIDGLLGAEFLVQYVVRIDPAQHKIAFYDPKSFAYQGDGKSIRYVWGPAGAVPIVGMEMMRRFTLTFDARRGLLYLEPNASFTEPVPAPS